MISPIIQLISQKLNISERFSSAVVDMLNDGSTIPFIARYRKELTGNLDELVISAIKNLYDKLSELEKRKETILKTIDEQGNLSEELKAKIESSWDSTELEDLYLPFKPKRKTRASIAMEKGLEPLAKIIMAQHESNINLRAERFLNDMVSDVEEALQGARDIIAEWINESIQARNRIRILFEKESIIYSKVAKGKEEEGRNFKDYFEFQEKLKYIPSHRFLAIWRGINEGILKSGIEPIEEKAIEKLENIFIKGNLSSSQQLKLAIKDSYKRLLQPSIETEYYNLKKEIADEEAINVFVKNLYQLLLEPPLGQKRVMGIDPGFRTGCKVVCLDEQGNLLHHAAIFPHPPQNEPEKSGMWVKKMIEQYQIEAIAIGDGTAGRETDSFIRNLDLGKDIKIFLVNEDGASVYSASEVAREEFGNYDLTVRGSVSIGRRLMDPLAELVKIDPKSIGVGQYQHDVDQTKLKNALDQTTQSCVNRVGVNVNTASKQLLNYVSGIGPVLAQNIIDYRLEIGMFNSRQDLKKVKRMGDKSYEQCAGFLRVNGSKNPLDNSAVHPESYYLVEKMANDLNCSVSDLISNQDLRNKIDPSNYVNEKAGLLTINDILKELEKPGRDPRQEIEEFVFDQQIKTIEDLVPDMILTGIVTNITNFGVFVDMGIKQDGMVHVSELSDNYVKNPLDVVKLKQRVTVKIKNVDLERNRIQLSMKGLNK